MSTADEPIAPACMNVTAGRGTVDIPHTADSQEEAWPFVT